MKERTGARNETHCHASDGVQTFVHERSRTMDGPERFSKQKKQYIMKGCRASNSVMLIDMQYIVPCKVSSN